MIKIIYCYVIFGFFQNNFFSMADNNDKDATVTSFGINQNPDGSYQYKFETTNGISQQEVGVGGYYAQGISSHYTPDGQLIKLNYLADESGYHPEGDHLPTPPPIPDYIIKALNYIRLHPSLPI